MKINKVIFGFVATILYAISFRTAIQFITGVNPIIEVCEYYTLNFSSNFFAIFELLLLPVLGYIYVKIMKMSNLGMAVFCFLFPFFSIIFVHHTFTNTLEDRLNNKTSKIIQAIIIEKDRTKTFRSIIYEVVNEIGTRRELTRSNKWSVIKKGDTILVKMDLNCNYIKRIYSLTPNKKELEYSKNSCYLIEGKLLASDKKTIISISKPYKKSKPSLIGYLFLSIIGLYTLFLIFVEFFYLYWVN